MKRLITEVPEEGFESLFGENLLIFCSNYIYSGTLIGVNSTCILLDEAKLVYETGAFSDKNYKDAQALPTKTWYIQLSAIESFGIKK